MMSKAKKKGIINIVIKILMCNYNSVIKLRPNSVIYSFVNT